jgi:hypothetical protein
MIVERHHKPHKRAGTLARRGPRGESHRAPRRRAWHDRRPAAARPDPWRGRRPGRARAPTTGWRGSPDRPRARRGHRECRRGPVGGRETRRGRRTAGRRLQSLEAISERVEALADLAQRVPQDLRARIRRRPLVAHGQPGQILLLRGAPVATKLPKSRAQPGALLASERADVADQGPAVVLRQKLPGRHGASAGAELPEDLPVRLGLDLLGRPVCGLGIERRRRRPVALALGAVAGHTVDLGHLLALRDGRRICGKRVLLRLLRRQGQRHSRREGARGPAPGQRIGRPMSSSSPAPEVSPAGVRTPLDTALTGQSVIGSRRCSVCGVVELRGRQTVCSAACRRERSRRREAERRRARDREIRALLEAALRKFEEGSP